MQAFTPGSAHTLAESAAPPEPPSYDVKARPFYLCAPSGLAVSVLAEDNGLRLAPSLQAEGMGVYATKDIPAGTIVLSSTQGIDPGHWVDVEAAAPPARAAVSFVDGHVVTARAYV
jgi:prepilin-type processing-associated H-X9-DG protein